MAPLTRRASSPRILLGREAVDSEEESASSPTSSDSSPSEEEEEEVVEEEAQEDERDKEGESAQQGGRGGPVKGLGPDQKGKASITISLKKVCKVCKGTDHQAGFRGATYIDCPKKPCFLCKMPGHTTMSCPHRVAMEHGVVPSPRRNTKTSLDYVFERQLKARIPMIKQAFVIPDQVDCAVIRLHSRRVTCLEFHPTKNNILLSGDKKGELGIWDYGKLHEKTVYRSIHSCILNNIKFSTANDGTLYTSSSDGTISCTDVETGIQHLLMDLNPDGWNGPASWRMLYGMEFNSEKSVLLAADNFGYLYLVDARTNKRRGEPILIHKKGSKVVGLHCNPVQPDLLLSCGNDHFARIWDIRRLKEESALYALSHGRVVNSAYFSPVTGCKILTTSQDNRIRVWDSIFGDLESPSRVIVHSHDFNRHLTPFRAEWDPKDTSESLAVIGRYISENYNGVALHPIDFIDTSTGKLVAEVTDPNIMTISPVNKLHPQDDVLASGSSRSLFVWKPRDVSDSIHHQKHGRKFRGFIHATPEKRSSGKFKGESDDEADFTSKGKNWKKCRATEAGRCRSKAKS